MTAATLSNVYEIGCFQSSSFATLPSSNQPRTKTDRAPFAEPERSFLKTPKIANPCNIHVTPLPPPSQSKPHFSRTKRFPIAYKRTKPITSNLNSASAHAVTPTFSIARNDSTRLTSNSAIRVAVRVRCCNTPRHQKRNCPARNTPSATHRGCSNATRTFYFPSAHLGPIAASQWPAHVRVSSEYSYIPTQRYADFLEPNTRFEVRERKSTLTSFFYSHGARGSGFQTDNCAYSSVNPAPIRNHVRPARKPKRTSGNLILRSSVSRKEPQERQFLKRVENTSRHREFRSFAGRDRHFPSDPTCINRP